MKGKIAGEVRFSLVDLLMFIVLLLLGACAPTASHVLNTATGDEMELHFVTDATTPCGETPGDGLCVAPGGEQQAERVRVSVFGDPLTLIDEAVCISEIENEAACTLGTITAPTFIRIAGSNVTATVLYRRPGSTRPYQESAF